MSVNNFRMNLNERNSPEPGLRTADAAALDALVHAGFDVTRVDPAHRTRAERLARLLGLLESGGVTADGLADRVLSAIQASATPATFSLSDLDGRALEALAEAGFRADDVSSPFADSARKHSALASLVTAKPAGIEWSPGLADRTFDLVMLMDRHAPIPMERAVRQSGLGRRFWDVAAVAAMLMVGASVLLPILTAVRARQTQIACSGRLGEIAAAMSAYAGANRNALPAATASFGGTWWNTGKDPRASNSANLFTLVREGYAKLRSLTCPSHAVQMPECVPENEPGPQTWDWPDISHISYSYQVMAGPNRPRWNDTVSVAVLADRSPVVLRALRNERVDPTENSPNHDGRGQSVLFIDGATRWLTSPVLGVARMPAGGGGPPLRVSEDNIWFPWQVEAAIREARQGDGRVTLTGREVPASPFDTFLAP